MYKIIIKLVDEKTPADFLDLQRIPAKLGKMKEYSKKNEIKDKTEMI